MSSPHARKAPPVGIAAGAEDAKYQAKYKELKRKVRDIEADNDKLHYKVLHAKLAVRRVQMERAVLYERLAVVPPEPHHSLRPIPSPPPRHPHLPPVQQYPPRTHYRPPTHYNDHSPPQYPDAHYPPQAQQIQPPPRPVSPPRRAHPHQRMGPVTYDRDYPAPDPYDDRPRDWDRQRDRDRERDRDYHAHHHRRAASREYSTHSAHSSSAPPAAPLPSPRSAREAYDPPPPRGPDSQGQYYHDYPPPPPPAPRRASRGASPGSGSASVERDGPPPQAYYEPERVRRGSFRDAPPGDYAGGPPPSAGAGPGSGGGTPGGGATPVYAPVHTDAPPTGGPLPPGEPGTTAGRKRTRAEMDMDADDGHAREYDVYEYGPPHEHGPPGGDGAYGHGQDERGAKRYAGARSRRSDGGRERDDDARMA